MKDNKFLILGIYNLLIAILYFMIIVVINRLTFVSGIFLGGLIINGTYMLFEYFYSDYNVHNTT